MLIHRSTQPLHLRALPSRGQLPQPGAAVATTPQDTLQSFRVEAPLLLAPPKPRTEVDLSKPLELSRAELDKPLKNTAWKAALKSVDPELKLSDLTGELFANDPASASDSSYRLVHSDRNGFRQVKLESTRELSQGKATTEVRRWLTEDGEQGKDSHLRYTSDSLPTVQQLPEVMQNGLGEFFTDSPQKMVESFEARHGKVGEPSSVCLYFGLGKNKYATLHYTTEKDGVASNLRFAKEGIDYSTSLKPTQLSASEALPKSIAKSWKQWGLKPGQMAERMLAQTGLQPGSVRVGISESESGTALKLGVNLADSKGEEAGYISRSFSRGESGRPNVYHDLLQLEDQFQGKGIVKRVLRNSFSLYQDLGVDKVDLQAAITVGGYAWARYGWQLKDKSQESISQQVKKRLEPLEVDTAVKRQVNTLLDGNSPRKLWAISDMRIPVSKDGKETTLGKALLLGTNWSGTFDMDDTASMKRLENYIGKR